MKLSLLIIFFTLGICLNANNVTSEDITLLVHRLVGDIAILQEQAGQQTKWMQKQDETIKAVESSVTLLTQVASMLQNTVVSLGNKLGEHASSIKAEKEQMSAVKQQLGEHTSSIKAEKEKLAAFEQKLGEHTSSIKAAKENISVVDQTLGEHTSSIEAEKEKISAFEQKLGEHTSSIKAGKEKMSAVEEELGNQTSSIQAQEEKMSAVEQEVGNQTSSIQAEKKRISAVEQELGAHALSIQETKSQIVKNALLVGVSIDPRSFDDQDVEDNIPSLVECLKWCRKKRDSKRGKGWETCMYNPTFPTWTYKRCISRSNVKQDKNSWSYNFGWIVYQLL